MFFDVGFAELFFLAVVGLLILGPERLPVVARTLGGWVRRGREMASDFQRELEREVDLKEIKAIKNDVNQIAQPLKEAAQTLDDGPSILNKALSDSPSADNTNTSQPDFPETPEHHEPMPSTETSAYGGESLPEPPPERVRPVTRISTATAANSD